MTKPYFTLFYSYQNNVTNIETSPESTQKTKMDTDVNVLEETSFETSFFNKSSELNLFSIQNLGHFHFTYTFSQDTKRSF